jgi:hypothetical protein
MPRTRIHTRTAPSRRRTRRFGTGGAASPASQQSGDPGRDRRPALQDPTRQGITTGQALGTRAGSGPLAWRTGGSIRGPLDPPADGVPGIELPPSARPYAAPAASARDRRVPTPGVPTPGVGAAPHVSSLPPPQAGRIPPAGGTHPPGGRYASPCTRVAFRDARLTSDDYCAPVTARSVSARDSYTGRCCSTPARSNATRPAPGGGTKPIATPRFDACVFP